MLKLLSFGVLEVECEVSHLVDEALQRLVNFVFVGDEPHEVGEVGQGVLGVFLRAAGGGGLLCDLQIVLFAQLAVQHKFHPVVVYFPHFVMVVFNLDGYCCRSRRGSVCRRAGSPCGTCRTRSAAWFSAGCSARRSIS